MNLQKKQKPNFIYRTIVLFLGLVFSIALAKSQIKMLESGTGKDVDPNKQAVYGAGGETKLNRITDLEKSVDYVKGRLQEIDDLKKRVEELEKSLGQKPASANTEAKGAAATPAASNIYLRK
jgi:hypothetical protein